MSEPIVFISHLRVKEGMLDQFKEASQETFRMLESSKPGTLLHLGYSNQDGSRVSFIHVFPSAQAMDDHMAGVSERVGKSLEFLQTEGYEIYGAPSEHTMRMMQQFAGSEVSLNVEPGYFGGYMRLGSP